MLAITGSTGQLGRLVIKELLDNVSAGNIIATMRDPAKGLSLKSLGVQVRHADYNRPETLAAAFKGVDKLLLISSSEIGQRAVQHRAVIDAAKQAGVGLIAYTSLLHADSSLLPIAIEHKETEAMLRSSGIPHVLLRNGWYTENYLANVPTALQHGVILGSAGEGKISSAARADYALAAATIMVSENHAGNIYELAGDESYTLAEFAVEIARQSGTPVSYKDIPQADFKAALLQAGLPEALATLIAESDAGAAKSGLFDNNKQLSQLIGRPTTSLAALVEATLVH